MTILRQIQVIQKMRDDLQKAEYKLHQNFAYGFVKHALDECSNDFFLEPADALAASIADRDHPLTKDEITEIFKISGFEFEQKHIEASRPESDASVNRYRAKEAADYASVYGWQE